MEVERRFLTMDEVADLLRLPLSTLRWWVHCGRGPRSRRVGKRRLFLAADVEAWIEECPQDPGGPAPEPPPEKWDDVEAWLEEYAEEDPGGPAPGAASETGDREACGPPAGRPDASSASGRPDLGLAVHRPNTTTAAGLPTTAEIPPWPEFSAYYLRSSAVQGQPPDDATPGGVSTSAEPGDTDPNEIRGA